jgi:hypothetical protein
VETTDFQGYFEFLCELTKTLAHLTEVEQRKTLAVRQDDLDTLNECMKQEQVISLTLRGYDQKRQVALAALNLESVSLSRLAAHVPESYRTEAKEISENLLRQYHLLKAASEVAQNTLECNLHQIDKTLADLGKESYQTSGPELPQPMRTDFRA